MGRLLRQVAGGEWHHAMNRGARHLPIFGDDNDRDLFLDRLGAAQERHGLGIHAYALMDNHYHLLVRADVPVLSQSMKSIGGAYTQRFNHKYGLDGPLFRGRFRSKPITEERYLSEVVRYIHRNPIESPRADLRDLHWTSHPAYMGAVARPRWLTTSTILERFNKDTHAFDAFVGYEPDSAPRIAPPRALRPGSVRNLTPADVERALGASSLVERSLLQAGGRGVRNDIRLACLLVSRDNTDWSMDALAARYGYRSTSGARTAISRARTRTDHDPLFRELVAAAQQRLVGVVRRVA